VFLDQARGPRFIPVTSATNGTTELRLAARGPRVARRTPDAASCARRVGASIEMHAAMHIVKAWWRSVRAAVTSGRVQRGVLYAVAAAAILLAALASVSPRGAARWR
jgi:hypothetical protein